MPAKRYCLVRHDDYDGRGSAVLQMYGTDDFRLTHPVLSRGLTVLAGADRCQFDRKAHTLTVDGTAVYRVFPDWSVKLVTAPSGAR